MQNALNQLRDWWANAPRPMRIGIVGGVVGLLVLFLALGGSVRKRRAETPPEQFTPERYQ